MQWRKGTLYERTDLSIIPNVRCWPKIASHQDFMGVFFGEIDLQIPWFSGKIAWNRRKRLSPILREKKLLPGRPCGIST
jgi:hypothetical protein